MVKTVNKPLNVAIEIKRAIKELLDSISEKNKELPLDSKSRLFTGKVETGFFGLFNLPNNQGISSITMSKLLFAMSLENI